MDCTGVLLLYGPKPCCLALVYQTRFKPVNGWNPGQFVPSECRVDFNEWTTPCLVERETISPTSSEELLRIDWTTQHASAGRTRPTAGAHPGRPYPTSQFSQFSSVQFSQMATPRAGLEIPGTPNKLHCKRTSAACGIMGMCGTISPTSSEELLRVEWTAPHASTGRT